MRNKDVEINIPIVSDMRRMEIVCHTGTTNASLSCRSSQGAHFILLHGHGKIVPLSWQSKKLTCLTKKPLAPLALETLEFSDAAVASYLIGSLINDFFLLPNMSIIKCTTDNKSLSETFTTADVTKGLQLMVDIAWLHQMEENQEICMTRVEGKNQLADCLTKGGASPNNHPYQLADQPFME